MSIANGQVASATDVLRGMTSIGHLKTDTMVTRTIAAGVATITSNSVNLIVESGVTDDVDTITPSGTGVGGDGYLLLLNANTVGTEVVLKHNTGNIICPDGRDVVLRTQSATQTGWALLVFVSSKWYVIGYHGLSTEQILFNHLNFS